MPRAGSGVPNIQEDVTKLREEAARARRLAAEMTNAADKQLLSELAENLESKATELERSGG